MDMKRARFYAWLSFGGALFMLFLTLLFALTLFYQSYRDNNGHGLNIVSQFLSAPIRGVNVAITTPFDKGSDYYNRDSEHRLMEEMLVRYYLDMRYSFIPDREEMMYRWGWSGPLARISTHKVHERVVSNNLEDKIKKTPNEIRTVNILKSERASNMKRYDVVMQIMTIGENGQFTSQTYSVVMHFQYSNSYKSMYREPINPYGLYFTNITTTKFLNN